MCKVIPFGPRAEVIEIGPDEKQKREHLAKKKRDEEERKKRNEQILQHYRVNKKSDKPVS